MKVGEIRHLISALSDNAEIVVMTSNGWKKAEMTLQTNGTKVVLAVKEEK